MNGTSGRVLLGAGAIAMSLAAVTWPAPPVAQEVMVQRTCAICHALPPPEILPKSAWKGVVRDMTALTGGPDQRFQRFTLTVRRRVWFRSRPI